MSLDDEYCTVMSLTIPSFDGFEFKYTYNKRAVAGEYSVANYDDYVAAVHDEYLTQRSAGSWFEWDHFLDQHIGLKYREVDAACAAKDNLVRKVLHERRIPVGERRCYEKLITQVDNYTSHYYTGYKGSLTWEFNLQCSGDDGAPDVCGCIASNNDLEFAAKTGYDCRDPDATSAAITRDGANGTTVSGLDDDPAPSGSGESGRRDHAGGVGAVQAGPERRFR